MTATSHNGSLLKERDLMPRPTPDDFALRPLEEYPSAELYDLIQAAVNHQEQLRKFPKDQERARIIQSLDVWGYRLMDAYKEAKKREEAERA